jgi:pimeloyl-ACP methyl ester carboxylesterase
MADDKHLELDDISISYSESGSGGNLILLHGNSESKAIFRKYQSKYFADFHTFALDSRGHGKSLSDDDEYSIGKYSDDVIGFCEKLGIRKASVIGYSDGGNIALFLAKKRPDLFGKLVAISPNYLASGTTDGALRLFIAVNRIFLALRRIGIDTRKWIMRFKLMLTDIGLTENDMRSIRTSMRFLYAENDMVKEEHVREIASFVPGSTIRKIGRCNHLSILKSGEAIAEMREYLEEDHR